MTSTTSPPTFGDLVHNSLWRGATKGVSGNLDTPPVIRLKTHGVKNRRRFSTPKTDMAENSDDDAVAAAIMHSYSCKA